MGRAMRKRVYGQTRTAKAQISQRIRAVRPGPSLSAYRIIRYYRMYEWKTKDVLILCACAYSKALFRLTLLNSNNMDTTDFLRRGYDKIDKHIGGIFLVYCLTCRRMLNIKSFSLLSKRILT